MTDERKEAPVTGPLREAVLRCSGVELLGIQRNAKISLEAIQRLVDGFGIRAESMDRLAVYFGLELRKKGE